MKHTSNETKIILGIIITSIVLIIGAIAVFSKQETASQVSFTREELLPSETQKKGNASASAYLVEFSDFQCPACKAFQPLISDIFSKYSDKLLFGYRHYPLPQHPFAEKAAYAAEAAGKQGKFWEYHDKLFAQNQDNFSDQMFSDIAKELGLNEEQFNQDKESSQIKEKVSNDHNAGNTFSVNATPTFYLNGEKLTLRSGQDLLTAIEDVIK